MLRFENTKQSSIKLNIHLHNNMHVSYIRYLISLHIREQINIRYFDRILRWFFISPSGNEC